MTSQYFAAAFESEEDLKAAVRAARQGQYVIADVFTPYAVHGMDEAMGLAPSRLSWVCLLFAGLGAGSALYFQYWVSSIDWPLNVGGKPFNSLPAFVPVTFELAVLFAGLGTVAALLARCRLFPGKRPAMPDPRVTDDCFVMLLAETDAAFDPQLVRGMCEHHHALWCGEIVDGHLHRFEDVILSEESEPGAAAPGREHPRPVADWPEPRRRGSGRRGCDLPLAAGPVGMPSRGSDHS